MSNMRTDCYARIMEGIFGSPMIPMEECDWVEFMRDMEDSLRSMPLQGRKCRKHQSMRTVLLLYGNGVQTKRIGPDINCPIERGRQILARALRLMRHPERSKRLRKWIAESTLPCEMRGEVRLSDQNRIWNQRMLAAARQAVRDGK